MQIEKGFCQCGCGEKTSLIKKTVGNKGFVKGEPRKFLPGHHFRGERHRGWSGGKTTDKHGKLKIRLKSHHRADPNGYVYEHILVCEKALGKDLNGKHPIHHADCDGTNNANDNFVICEDNAYHMFLHLRTRAYNASGNAAYRKCQHCQKWDAPENLYIGPHASKVYHRSCANTYHNEWKKERKCRSKT